MNRNSVTESNLRGLAELASTTQKPASRRPRSTGRLDVPKWLTAHDVEYFRKEKTTADGRDIFLLDECPFNPEHGSRGETCVMQDPSGKLSFKCQHASCSQRSWKDVREALGKPDKDHFEGPEPDEPGSRVIVEVTNDEHAVNEQVAAQLANDPDLFQRAGELVHVVTDAEVPDSIHRSSSGTRIRQLPRAALRDRISQLVDFRKSVVTEKGEYLKELKPADSCVTAIHSQGSWLSIRPITGLITTATIRPDGTFIITPGYDEKTGLYLRPYGEIPDLPENPSRQDASDAATRLREVFGVTVTCWV